MIFEGDFTVELHKGSKQIANTSQSLSQGAIEQASSVEQLSASIDQIAEQITRNAGNAKSAYDKASLSGTEMDMSSNEMARAGEAGKGFSVVADEVRNFAGKSAEAAKDTASLIKAAADAIDKAFLIATATKK